MEAGPRAGAKPGMLPFCDLAASENLRSRPGFFVPMAGEGAPFTLADSAATARWAALYDMVVKLTHSLYGGDPVSDILHSSVELLGALGGRLFMYDPDSGDMILILSYAKSGQALGEPGLRARPGAGLAGQVYEQRRPVVVQDYAAWPGRLLEGAPHCALGVPLLSDEGVLGVLIITDGVDRVFTEEDTQLLTVFASQISAVLISARDRGQLEAAALREERARLARDLHDGLAQDLAAVLLRVDLCRSLANAQAELGGHEHDLAAQLAAMQKMVRRSIRETRATILALHASDDARPTVENALRSLAERFTAQNKVPVDVILSGTAPASLRVAHELTLVRVAQEALTNVRAHAAASRVEMRVVWPAERPGEAGHPAGAVSPAGRNIQLSIADNGRGFDPDQAPASGTHWGLLFMRERVEALGGRLVINSAPGRGTQISISLPAEKDESPCQISG